MKSHDFPIQPLETAAGFRNHPQKNIKNSMFVPCFSCFPCFPMVFFGNSWDFPGIHRAFPQASSHWASALHLLGAVETQRLTPNVILRSAAIGACEKVRRIGAEELRRYHGKTIGIWWFNGILMGFIRI